MEQNGKMDTFVNILRKRRIGILDWINNSNTMCQSEQKHLDNGTPEQAYWNHGYASAIKDMLNMLGDSNTSKH